MSLSPGPSWSWVLPVTLLLSGCGITPLDRRIAVGEDPFLIFVAEGADGTADLFASLPGGETAIQLTYTRAPEAMPALSSQGTALAFLRGDQETGFQLVIMNLLSGSEAILPLPESAGHPARLGWISDGSAVVLATQMAGFVTEVPPARLHLAAIPEDLRATADSALWILLGDPPFARVVDCEMGDVVGDTDRTLCSESRSGEQTQLVFGATDPFRWGGDSVGYRVNHRIIVRPLAGGRPREMTWTAAVKNPRQPTAFIP